MAIPLVKSSGISVDPLQLPSVGMDRRSAAGDREGADARDEVDQQEDHAHRVISCYAARRKEASGAVMETVMSRPFPIRGVGRILLEGD